MKRRGARHWSKSSCAFMSASSATRAHGPPRPCLPSRRGGRAARLAAGAGTGLRLRVAGVDEAGRGPLAGPVVAAAVILRPGRPIPGVADSKLLTAASRERLSVTIRRRALCFGIGWADPKEIDSLNILHAKFLAMH